MYYIYHIPGVKIGCTIEPHRRARNQKYEFINEYEIIEEHSCIYKASEREIELQKEYGYKVDKLPYYKSIKMSSFKSCSKGGKIGGSKGGKIGGKRGGLMNVKSGHIKKIHQLAIQKLKKPIIQYDLEGSYIAEWESVTEISKKLGFHKRMIRNVCIGKQKKSYGFIWKYKD